MICCQFIFQPGTYDDDFHRLDGQIDDYARSLPGFVSVEKWVAPEGGVVNAIYYFADMESVRQLAQFPQHREAKDQVQRWYGGYRIVVSEVSATYGDGRLIAGPEVLADWAARSYGVGTSSVSASQMQSCSSESAAKGRPDQSSSRSTDRRPARRESTGLLRSPRALLPQHHRAWWGTHHVQFAAATTAAHG